MARKKEGERLFDTHVKPRFSEIEQWARAGATHKEIAAALNISYQSFCNYKNNEPELRTLMLNAQMCGVPEIKMALWKRAKGYTYTETRTITKTNEDGSELVTVETTTKECPPDVSAIAMYLRNNADDWRDKDSKFYEYKDEELKLQRERAELQEYR